MSPPLESDLSGQSTSPARRRFLQCLAERPIKPAHHPYYLRWAEFWTKARGNRSADATTAFFDALGRSTHIADWQFRQAVSAVRILAREILTLPWAASFDWQGLYDQARTLEPDHRTLGRENIQVRAALPPCGSGVPPQSVPGASRSATSPNRSLETSEGRWYSPVMTTQFLTDDRGQKVAVVIPIADYESLMEDVADLAAVAERRDDDRISLNELKKQLTADGLLPR